MRAEADAYELLEQLRWGGRPTSCPHCGADGPCYFLRPRRPTGRRTRSGAPTDRRVWKCGVCRRQFSVLVGTVLQGTRVSLWTWIALLEDWATTGPMTAREAADRYDLSSETARHLVRRVELAGGVEPARTCLAGLSPARPPTMASPG